MSAVANSQFIFAESKKNDIYPATTAKHEMITHSKPFGITRFIYYANPIFEIPLEPSQEPFGERSLLVNGSIMFDEQIPLTDSCFFVDITP